jgi:hypothetical protein
MVPGNLQRLLAACLLAFYALAGGIGASGLVLCIEPDGRLALESAGARGCADDCGDDQDASGPATELGGCACTDVPLLPAGPHPRPASSGSADAPAPAALPAASAAWIAEPRSGLAPPRAHAPPRREARLRISTVVLRS